MDQAPTAAKFGAVTEFASAGVSRDLAGGLLEGSDEGPGASADLEGS